MNSSRPSTLESVQSILRKRAKITDNMVGEFIILTVSGNGTVLEVKNKAGENVPSADGSGQILRKKIFNLKCNSGVAVSNARNMDILRAGRAAELAGKAEEAAELFNQYLNKTRVSVNVLSTSALFDKIKGGDQIKGKIQRVTTDNGTLLTIDASTITIKEAGYGEESTDLDLFAMTAAAKGSDVPADKTATVPTI